MTLPRGIRGNNPGNIVKSGIHWLGERPGADDKFETFATPEHGIRALAKLLVRYQEFHGLNTARQIVNRWAPPQENDTERYVRAVAGRLGDVPLELRNVATLRAMVIAIIWHENGMQPYRAEVIDRGILMALGGEV
jgi:hypothetical protein